MQPNNGRHFRLVSVCVLGDYFNFFLPSVFSKNQPKCVPLSRRKYTLTSIAIFFFHKHIVRKGKTHWKSSIRKQPPTFRPGRGETTPWPNARLRLRRNPVGELTATFTKARSVCAQAALLLAADGTKHVAAMQRR